ncbi:hypothetical protein ACPOL_2113 [Acidisarcina polymorpha]|uniref:Uncharacterized protein n=1 Tax=Acidisarcina polymorpha TaxID=2211140 RepID=A0A2Z5FY92_9BACT|nr:hypothetical protein ACPOL_2113 [Acidisarcina polymorpha]
MFMLHRLRKAMQNGSIMSWLATSAMVLKLTKSLAVRHLTCPN